MGSQTPFFALPYPVGTDRVTDGDNAIQALAEKVEATIKGTGAAPRTWAGARGGSQGAIGPGVWTGLVAVTATGAPIGAVLAVFGSINLAAVTPGGQAMARITSSGGTMAPAGAVALANQFNASYWNNLAVFGICTATVASPGVSLEAYVNTGNLNYDPGAHLVIVRIV